MHNLDRLDLVQAMHGYNPFLADAFGVSGDPGIMNGKIFYGQCNWYNGRAIFPGYWDFIAVRKDLKCDTSARSESFRLEVNCRKNVTQILATRSTNQYQRERSSSYSFEREISASLDAEGPFGFKASASAKHTFNRDTSSNSASKFLGQENGEIVISKAGKVLRIFIRSRFFSG